MDFPTIRVYGVIAVAHGLLRRHSQRKIIFKDFCVTNQVTFWAAIDAKNWYSVLQRNVVAAKKAATMSMVYVNEKLLSKLRNKIIKTLRKNISKILVMKD